jgi:heme exporter protein C
MTVAKVGECFQEYGGGQLRRLQVLSWVWPVITLGLLGYGLHVALYVVPPDADQGNVGRILYYHVPTWIATSLCFLANLIGSIAYLVTRKRSPEFSLKADALAVSSAEMGVVFCFLGMATGSLWGRVAGEFGGPGMPG